MRPGTATTRSLALLLAFWPTITPSAENAPIRLPTLTSARAAHQLSIPESRRAYPVRLRVVVTYYDPYIDLRRPALFVSDSTGGVFISLSSTPAVPLKAGQLIDVTGVSGSGDFAPIVEHASARLVGESHLPPKSERVSMTNMLTGAEDGHWVEIEGVVRSVQESGMNIFLNLALGDGSLIAGTVREHAVNYASLVDAKIRLRGNVAPTFNHQMQLTGAHILFPGIETLTVLKPAPADAFALPISPVGGLLRFTANSAFRHRVHIRGSVTLFWPGDVLCIQDGARGICAQTDQVVPVKQGEVIDVIGFPAVGEFTPTLTSASYRLVGRAQPVAPVAVTATEALRGDYDARMVELDGQLISEDKAAKNPTIILSSGKSIFSVVRPSRFTEFPAGWEMGSTLKITGICSVQGDADERNKGAGFSVPVSFRIMLRSTSDVVVIRKRSWWTAAHALWVLACALLVIVLAAAALLGQVRRGRVITSKLRAEVRERRKAEEATAYALDQMDYQAHHDPLTSLANRLLFNKSMRELLALAEKKGTNLGLLYLDLDRFKAINDTLGHAAGDLLLKQAAERLTRVSPAGSILSRLGGDEFAFLLPGIKERSHAEAIAQKVIDVMAVQFLIEGMPWHCPASIGVSLFPEDAQSASVLQRNADTALYRAKRTCPGHFVTFDRSMSEQAERSVLVEKALRRAMQLNSFSLVYQPQFLAQGGLCGLEALLRLDDEVLGPISPAEFITVAEEIGLIVPIGEWVLREACRQRAAWGYTGHPDVAIAVNVSPAQLKRGDFPLLVRKVLAKTGLPAELLELELTETGIFAHAHENLLELKSLGVRLAVDDFGTGFSSLSSLNRAPVDCVKIDRSFVRDASSTPGTLPFIRNIVSLARSLGMKTVAEGVETAAQMEAVKSAGCDIVQGFLLSYPLVATKAGALLQSQAASDRYDFELEPLVVARL